ncbi:MAG TPA: hypothetical protein VK497_02630 [Candidatus Saccharimonadales bacterium]|nr:hypothetical protein [Candidatus Saccharimonadales bacterium]
MSTTRQQALDAAKKKPADRSPEEQGHIDANKGDQAVRNVDFEAKRQQRAYGPG